MRGSSSAQAHLETIATPIVVISTDRREWRDLPVGGIAKEEIPRLRFAPLGMTTCF